MKKSIWIVLICSLILSAKTIKDIKFDGLVHLSPDIAKEMVDIKPNQEIDIEKIDKAIKKFYQMGYFKDIWVTEENGVVTFHFKEKPLISKIDVIGYLQNKKDELPSILGIKKGDIYDEEKIEEAKEKIIQHAKEEGYYDTVVEVNTKNLPNGSVEVDFLVNKGEI